MYTSHGFQIAGTPVEGDRPPVARCGGPGLCVQCSREAQNQQNFLNQNAMPAEFTVGDVIRVARHDFRIKQMTKMVGQPPTIELVSLEFEALEEMRKNRS